jgi:hypothetical protein
MVILLSGEFWGLYFAVGGVFGSGGGIGALFDYVGLFLFHQLYF